ncbi:MAG: DUF2027 domain-containing protein [Prevotella sp.]|nr:DUF2027 domain-containing protein [Prevotella sp.]
MKIGDNVRFLNEAGGGRVAGFQGKNIVLVEDEDGFQIPMMTTEVVVVDNDDYDPRRVAEKKVGVRTSGHAKGDDEPQSHKHEIPDPQHPTSLPPEERKGGDSLSVFLAFVPIDIREITHTRFETFLVNDSNYHVRCSLLVAEGHSWQVKFLGEVEPNTKVFVEEFGREDLGNMEHLAVQMMAYKRHKPFMLKAPVSTEIKVDPVKFYKLHTFRENEFFETPAMVFPVVENDRVPRPLVVDARQLKAEMYSHASNAQNANNPGAQTSTYVRRYADGKGGHPFANKHKEGDEPVVVDLHAHELLETTAGMSASDILNHQLDVFRRTLADYSAKKGTRIVFIHGKGEGVLRRALIHELKYSYKTYTYQDASFLEYGYGATQVTIK